MCAVLSALAMGVGVRWRVFGEDLLSLVRLEVPHVRDEKEEEVDKKEKKVDEMLDSGLVGLDAGMKREDREGETSSARIVKDKGLAYRNLDLRRYLFHALVIGAAGFSWCGFLVMVGHSRYSPWKRWN